MATGTTEIDSVPLFGISNSQTSVDRRTQNRNSNDGAPKVKFDTFLEYYKIRKRPGKYLIFNHFTFDDKTLPDRQGTDRDVARIKETFDKLRFEGKVFNDLKYYQISIELMQAFADDYSDYTSLFVFILTHGHENGQLSAKDGPYDFDRLLKSVTESSVKKGYKTLVGRPKVFIVQACQGQAANEGLASGEGDDENQSSILPLYSEFLFAFATPPGYVSYRNTAKGSWFIQTLCDAIDKYGHLQDFERILKAARREVAINYETPGSDLKQMPMAVTTLTKTLFLTNDALQRNLRQNAV
ncbi:Caspase-3 [Chamberlinius hualienensis]